MNKGGKRRNYCPVKFNGLFPTRVQIKRATAYDEQINADCTHATAREYII
jgi:hypothetical protein